MRREKTVQVVHREERRYWSEAIVRVHLCHTYKKPIQKINTDTYTCTYFGMWVIKCVPLRSSWWSPGERWCRSSGHGSAWGSPGGARGGAPSRWAWKRWTHRTAEHRRRGTTEGGGRSTCRLPRSPLRRRLRRSIGYHRQSSPASETLARRE